MDLNMGMYEQCKQLCLRIYKKKDMWCLSDRLLADYQYARVFQTPDEQIKCLKRLQEDDEQYPEYCFILGNTYFRIMQYDNAITEYEKVLERFNKWPSFYANLGDAYIQTKQYDKAEKLFIKAERNFPGDPVLSFNQTILAFCKGDSVTANNYINKFILDCKGSSWSESRIALNLALIYSETGTLNKAEDLYRKAYLLEPGNPSRLNYYVKFLIDKDRNINEGLKLIDKALALDPDDYDFMDTKGWGLYKQGKFQQAFEVLQRSWDLRMGKALYDHDAYLHLEAAKKAVADLN
jgi:tetratricopeptide (TPR) repeat protein